MKSGSFDEKAASKVFDGTKFKVSSFKQVAFAAKAPSKVLAFVVGVSGMT